MTAAIMLDVNVLVDAVSGTFDKTTLLTNARRKNISATLIVAIANRPVRFDTAEHIYERTSYVLARLGWDETNIQSYLSVISKIRVAKNGTHITLAQLGLHPCTERCADKAKQGEHLMVGRRMEATHNTDNIEDGVVCAGACAANTTVLVTRDNGLLKRASISGVRTARPEQVIAAL